MSCPGVTGSRLSKREERMGVSNLTPRTTVLMVKEGAECEVGRGDKARKPLPQGMTRVDQTNDSTVLQTYFIKHLLITYLEVRRNAPWRKAEKESNWRQTAHIPDAPQTT